MQISLRFCVTTPLPHRVPLGPRVRHYPGRHIWEHAEVISEFVAKIYVDADVDPERNTLLPKKEERGRGERGKGERGRERRDRQWESNFQRERERERERERTVADDVIRQPFPTKGLFASMNDTDTHIHTPSHTPSHTTPLIHTPSLPSLPTFTPLRMSFGESGSANLSSRHPSEPLSQKSVTPMRGERMERGERGEKGGEDDMDDKQEAADSVLSLPLPLLLSQLFPHRKLNVEIERMKADVTHATLNYIWWFFDDWVNEVVEPPLPPHSTSEYPGIISPFDEDDEESEEEEGEVEGEKEMEREREKGKGKKEKGKSKSKEKEMEKEKEKGKKKEKESKSKGKEKEGKGEREREKEVERDEGNASYSTFTSTETECKEPFDTLQVSLSLSLSHSHTHTLSLLLTLFSSPLQDDVTAQGSTELRVGTAAIRVSFGFVFIRFCQSANTERLSSYYLPFCSLLARRWTITVVKVRVSWLLTLT